jgi:type IV secretory pathway TraG/TraD family ATPase VirD4
LRSSRSFCLLGLRAQDRFRSRQQVARRLIKPEEVLQGMRYDEQIVLVQNAAAALRSRDLFPKT